jgi:hypothetical protein
VKFGKFRMIAGTKSLSSPTVFWLDYMEIFRRYNGSRAMQRFFMHFYFNQVLHSNFDLSQIDRAKDLLFARWKSLSSTEQSVLERKSSRGASCARMMIAAHVFDAGEHGKARRLYLKSISEHPMLLFHHSSYGILLRTILGNRTTRAWTSLKERLIKLYRTRKYQYRYTQKAEGRS